MDCLVALTRMMTQTCLIKPAINVNTNDNADATDANTRKIQRMESWFKRQLTKIIEISRDYFSSPKRVYQLR